MQPLRRRVVLGGLLTLIESSVRVPVCAAADRYGERGCWIPSAEVPGYFARAGRAEMFESGDEPIEQHSGVAGLDQALAQSLAMLATLFNVLPAFAYYRDGVNRENAKATPKQLLQRADGTVLFGLEMLRKCLAMPQDGDAAVVAVCAHEFGHIVSFKNGDCDRLVTDSSQPFRSEQYADFLAGYFAGRRKLERPSFPAVAFATTQRSFAGGDHGTADQRGEAVMQGFMAAYQQRMNIKEGTKAALTFSMARMP
jgi:hypothetical protein